ncbi:TonB-dependent receptor [uncultured Ramlibacter sp.]|uniref:TonB-dependent receptor domain-containing protein n=1 Tax=uncultured Ramlibacter sp. TaxID=260755 RepID=UPI00260CF837|nr:TonB-dependent receptor [uncultured Ramlibacter sp.]
MLQLHPFHLSRSVIALAASACMAPVLAQQVQPMLSPVVVTASGHEQAIKDAPASVSVITREDLDKKPYTSLQEVVRELEGVSIVGGSPNETDISIRGMPGEYTLILVDGKRQNTRETMNRGTGGVQANLIPPLNAIERIEVVRGPMSALYGADAIGGVINIITRKVPKAWSGSLTAGGTLQQHDELGNTALGSFWVGGPVKDDVVGLQFYGQVRDRKEDSVFYPLNATSGAYGAKDEALTAKLTVKPAANHELTFELGTEDFTYTSTPGRTITTPAAATTVLKTRHTRDNWALTHNGRYSFGQSTVALYRESAKQIQWRPGGQNPVVPELTNTVLDALLTAPIGNSLAKFGGQYIHNELEGISAQDAPPGGYTVNPNTVSLKSWSLFAEDELFLTDKFTLTGGLRLDDDERYGSHWTPRLYGVYQMAPAWTLRGGAAKGFKAPTIRQSTPGYCMTTGGQGGAIPGTLCGDPDLKAETSVSSEIGVRFDSGVSSVSATLFNNDFKNKVASYDTGIRDPRSAGRNIYVYDNVDKVTLRGLEVGASTKLSAAWALAGNYTYTDSSRKGGGEPAFNGSSLEGRPLDKTPEHMFNAQLDWAPTAAWKLYAHATYFGEQQWAAFRNGALGVRERGSSTTFDLGGSYIINKSFSVKAALLNITDKIVPVDPRARTAGLNGNWMVDEGRRLSVTLDAQF